MMRIDFPSSSELMRNYNLRPQSSLGQHFLSDVNFARRIASSLAEIDSSSLVIDIGAGIGGLTRALLELDKVFVLAIEYDRRCLEILEQLQKKAPLRLKIIIADALNFSPLSVIRKEDFSDIRIASNLPYNIAVRLILGWLSEIRNYRDITLMLQREIALRICARSGKSYGRLSVAVGRLCECKKLFPAPKEIFIPQPQISSMVIRLTPLVNPIYVEEEKFSLILRHAFGQRRKTLRHSLSRLGGEKLLAAAEIDSGKRAEEISIEEFCRLSSVYSEKLCDLD